MASLTHLLRGPDGLYLRRERRGVRWVRDPINATPHSQDDAEWLAEAYWLAGKPGYRAVTIPHEDAT